MAIHVVYMQFLKHPALCRNRRRLVRPLCDFYGSLLR